MLKIIYKAFLLSFITIIEANPPFDYREEENL